MKFSMKSNVLQYVHEYFERIGFKKQNELDDDQSYSVEYTSDVFVVKLEKYRREFYVTLYRTGHPDDEIGLFNLLQYLNKGVPEAFEANYFSDESNIDECYRKQLQYLSATVQENLTAISEFFRIGDYDLKIKAVQKFMMEKYPQLFKKN